MSALADKNRQKAEERILKAVTIKCKECNGSMIRVRDLRNQTIVGYSCENCTHYYLFH